MKKKAVIISCFNYYENRLKYIEEELKKKNYEVIYIHSNFDHISKKNIVKPESLSSKVIEVPEYTKNLSLKRIYSHYIFSKKVYENLKKINPDLVYSIIPPNFLSLFVSLYKKKKKKTTVVFDIYDLWPETFPMKKMKRTVNIFLKPWSMIRDISINKADLIITECNLYKSKLGLDSHLSSIESGTLYLTKMEKEYEGEVIKNNLNSYSNKGLLKISYLGSINNIIDIEAIILILKYINTKKKIELNIIGNGEKKTDLLNSLNKAEIKYIDHGAIFSFNEKQKILGQCQLAINIMKPTVEVGLTMKSIEYFQYGLPLINNIKSDTFDIVEKYDIGFNIGEDISKLDELLSITEIEKKMMRLRARKVFEELFSEKAFKKQLKQIFLNIK